MTDWERAYRDLRAGVEVLRDEWNRRYAASEHMTGCPHGAGYYDLLALEVDDMLRGLASSAPATASEGATEGCVPCGTCGRDQRAGWCLHPVTSSDGDRIYVPTTEAWWEPTDDPAWMRTVDPCTEDCHHPVHAFNPERLHHIENTEWLRANAGSPPGT